MALTDSTPATKRTYGYDLWGTLTGGSDLGALGGRDRARWKWALWFGQETEIYYMRARWYDPGTGRFLSEDPIGLDGGINPSVFAGDDPVNGSDPSGLECIFTWHPSVLTGGFNNVITETPGYWTTSGCRGGGGGWGGNGIGLPQGGGGGGSSPQNQQCWAAGVNLEFSAIIPLFSSGGGSYGWNIEWTSGSGLAFYRYGTPDGEPSYGFLVGPSLTVNFARGKGAWTGLFESVAGSAGSVTIGKFWSPPSCNGTGFEGWSGGWGKGPIGLGYTTTNYKLKRQLTSRVRNGCTGAD